MKKLLALLAVSVALGATPAFADPTNCAAIPGTVIGTTSSGSTSCHYLVINADGSINATTSGGGGGGAVFGPTANGSPAANPPVLMGGTSDGTATGNVGNAKVDSSGNQYVINSAGAAIIGKVGIDQTTPGTTNGVQVNAALPAGANIVGKVGIDQTTPGTTNGVQVNAALPAGTNAIGHVVNDAGAAIIGKVGIDQTTPGTTNGVQINAALPAGTNVIGHTINDSGSTTAVTGNVTVVQPTGTNLHAVLDTTSTTAVTQATGTNLHAVLDTTSTTAVTQATGSNLHAQLDSGSTTAATQATGTNLHTVTDATSVTQTIPATTGGLTTGTITAAASTNATNLKASAGMLYHISGYSAAAVPTWVTFYNTAGTPTCGTAIVYEALIPVNSTSGGGFVEDIPDGLVFGTGIGYCITTAIGGTGAVAATSIVMNFGYK